MTEPSSSTRRIRRWAHEWWVTLRLGRKRRRYLASLPPFDGEPSSAARRVCPECGGTGTWGYRRGETPRPWHARNCSLDPSPPRRWTGTGWPRA